MNRLDLVGISLIRSGESRSTPSLKKTGVLSYTKDGRNNPYKPESFMKKYNYKTFKIGWIKFSYYFLGKKFSINFSLENNWG